jgi:hypothetical protein
MDCGQDPVEDAILVDILLQGLEPGSPLIDFLPPKA